MKIKKGDNVIVLAGKNKGQKGEITKVISETNKVIVGGINKVKKHLKPKNRDQKGTTIEIEAPINASNVMVLDPKTVNKLVSVKRKLAIKMFVLQEKVAKS